MMRKQRTLLNIVTFDSFSLSKSVERKKGDMLASLKRDSVRCIKTK